MPDVDPVDELAGLTRQLRAQLVRHVAAGAWAAPGAPTARASGGVVEEIVEPRQQIAASAKRERTLGEANPSTGEPVIPLGRRTLAEIRADVGDCQRCKLCSTRKSIVFGVGAEDAPLMFVGEAPGEQEDKRGEPFVGPAGELLDKMIEAMGWRRQDVYITNILMCRPPGNRNPQPDEVAQCSPFLHAKIATIAPRMIVALGRPAANHLLGTDAPIS